MAAKIGKKKLIIGAALTVAVIGSVTAFVVSRRAGPAGEGGLGGAVAATVGQALDALAVGAPSLDFSVSPLGELGLSAFDLGSDVADDLFGNIGVDSDFSYEGDLTLEVPEAEIAAPTEFSIEMPAEEQPSEGEQSQSQANAANCAQFSSVPSCSYVTDPNGRTLCEACKAAGY